MRLTFEFRGGVRGIIELEVLRAIEQALGGHIPIQSLFDLIIGTRCVVMNLSGRRVQGEPCRRIQPFQHITAVTVTQR